MVSHHPVFVLDLDLNTIMACISASNHTAPFHMRPLQISDASAIHDALSDWEVARWLSSPPWPYTLFEATSFIERVTAPAASSGSLHLTIADKDSDAMMGMIGVVPRDGSLSIGYWLSRIHWGRGIMTRALRVTCSGVFEMLPAAHIDSYVFEGNAASLRVQRKIGFEVVGQGTNYCRPQNKELNTIRTRLLRSDLARP